mmetsp:Transcript_14076/g.30512  ORF Transcript_14076/g.30512 Transcript_14076/m.30512 type:complete len:392 (+) Transcript_14076:244-1419(+)|eukprot:CAMPEP_0202892780 /NCGR_PEP_ID=MMETSP1392-20130828/2474_1 /ASSEMBLY_ACC=CAM_ASM_000868 /TAXON_ID=225041 /ORGANISM="Chlamydomonas chlamydogama, Strain SAG 11-48b" /LENGTH=391 /DNA_ID=CAMNT_0049576861 /DNA_START=244 /DNA_END=1419 /DNA_ORIENTATION=-
MAYPGPLPRVQNFKVLKVLGKGSYGKVYKVQRDSDEQYYALKETELGNLNHMERMDAVNEVRILFSISHANVIRYHEAFLNNNKLCVVMEYAPYGDLRYYIQKGQRLKAPFPEEAVWRIFLQLCKGLAALHSNHIVHRDIKPANIFLCQNDLLKIGDLGIAKALTRNNFARTQIGTPCYMAPEVWSGKPYSYSSDLWSVGCVLYEMLTFKTPMDGRSMQELKVRICSGRFTPVPSGRYSADLINLCHRLLTLDPARRPTASEILSCSAAQKWMRVLPTPPPARRWSENGAAPTGAQLINTIVVPRDLRQLPKKLPPPSYDSDAAAKAAAAKPAEALPRAAPPPSGGAGMRPSSGGIRPASGLPPLGGGVPVPSALLQAPAMRPGLRRVSYS